MATAGLVKLFLKSKEGIYDKAIDEIEKLNKGIGPKGKAIPKKS